MQQDEGQADVIRVPFQREVRERIYASRLMGIDIDVIAIIMGTTPAVIAAICLFEKRRALAKKYLGPRESA